MWQKLPLEMCDFQKKRKQVCRLIRFQNIMFASLVRDEQTDVQMDK